MSDHYPWSDAERAAIMTDICAALGASGVMVNPPPPPPAPAGAPRFVKHGYYRYCQDCGLEESFCGCSARTPAQPSNDARDASDLNRRIREAQTRTAAAPHGYTLSCGSCGGRFDACDGCRGGR